MKLLTDKPILIIGLVKIVLQVNKVSIGFVMSVCNIEVVKYYNAHAQTWFVVTGIQSVNLMHGITAEIDFKVSHITHNRFIFSVRGIGRFG